MSKKEVENLIDELHKDPIRHENSKDRLILILKKLIGDLGSNPEGQGIDKALLDGKLNADLSNLTPQAREEMKTILGKDFDNQLAELKAILNSDDESLDTLQEIVDTLKSGEFIANLPAELKAGLKGDKGDTGANGVNGENGRDGTSVVAVKVADEDEALALSTINPNNIYYWT